MGSSSAPGSQCSRRSCTPPEGDTKGATEGNSRFDYPELDTCDRVGTSQTTSMKMRSPGHPSATVRLLSGGTGLLA